jgi:HrpA-like RNA helicase
MLSFSHGENRGSSPLGSANRRASVLTFLPGRTLTAQSELKELIAVLKSTLEPEVYEAFRVTPLHALIPRLQAL